MSRIMCVPSRAELRTDATFWRRGTKDLTGTGRVASWHFLSGVQRLKWTITLFAVLIWFIWGWVSGDSGTLTVMCSAAAYSVIVGVRESIRVVTENKEREREKVIAKSMASRLGSVQGGTAKEWVNYAPARRGRPTTVSVKLPGTYDRSLRQVEKDAELVARKAGFKVGHDFEVVEHTEPPLMVVREMEVPPEVVSFEMALPYLEQAGNGRYFLGLGVRECPLWIDLNQQAPHIAWSCGTGAGKTVAGRNLASQIRREGGRVDIFDFAKEGESHGDWVYDEHGELFPGIRFYTAVEAAHEALVELGEERSRRARLVTEARRYRRPEPEFQRVLVIIEEMNTGTPELMAYWKRLRQEIKAETGEEQPLESPAITAYRDLVCKGRSTMMNVLAVAQRFDAKVTAGGDIRANFGERMLARFDDQARRMLIPEINPKPVSSSHRGRMILCRDGKAHAVQGVYMDIEQTREWAFGGDAVEPVRSMRPVEVDVAPQASEQGVSAIEVDSAAVATLSERSIPKPAGLVTLAQAADQRVVPLTAKAMKNARDRKEPGFPTPADASGKAWLYRRADLKAWHAMRGADSTVDIDGGA